jgi:hypothetical protein
VAQDDVPKNETDDNGVLRLPIRERNYRDIGESRNLQSKKNGLSLNEIRQVYFEITGDDILGKQVADQVADELGRSGRFTVTTDKESADAALKLYVRHESDTDEPDEKTVAVIVRLVNAKGFVVYPNRKGISGWKYVDTIRKLPLRVAADLVNAKK